MADNLLPSSADVTEFGSLNLPEPSGPHRPVMGLLYLYLYIYIHTHTRTVFTFAKHSTILKVTLMTGYYVK
jgi:hypothetical protein